LSEVVRQPIIDRVYKLIISDISLEKDFDEINKYPDHWINFKNGMYSVKEWKMYPHNPKYLSINQIPYSYFPDIDVRPRSGQTIKQSTLEEFISEIIPDECDRLMLYEYIGYCMVKDTSQQKFMIITGPGGTGKSTIIRLIEKLIGKENICSIALQDLNKRFYPTQLQGKLLNSCADISKAALDQTDIIKKITGEDSLLGEYKGGKIFAFKSYAKLLFSANEIPVSLDDKSNAFFRRFLIVRIDKRSNHIDDLERKLHDEILVLLQFVVAALRDMYNRGSIIESDNSKASVVELYKDSDTVMAYMEECLNKDGMAKVSRDKLYSAYERYCNQNERGALSRNGFYKNLRTKGFSEIMDPQGIRYFKGITFKDTEFIRVATTVFNN
jgi:P4 family phage/plasmid primase-like protien